MSSEYQLSILKKFLIGKKYIRLDTDRKIIDQIISDAESGKHDLVFLVKATHLVYQLEDNSYRTIALKNIVYAQLTKYLASFAETTNIISFALTAAFGSLSASTGLHFYKVLMIDRFQNNLDALFSKGKPIEIDHLPSIIVKSFYQAINFDNWGNITKNIASNAYSFVSSNFNFFKEKLTKPANPKPMPESTEIIDDYFSQPKQSPRPT